MAFNIENSPLLNQGKKEEVEEKAPKKRPQGRPKNNNIVRGVSVQEGLTADYTRATFIIRVDLLERVKDYAYTERLTMKEAIDELLGDAMDRAEKKVKKNGSEILKRKGGAT